MGVSDKINRTLFYPFLSFLPFLFALWLCFGLILGLKSANADIYMKVGRNGTVHFSNVPASGTYNLYMVTRRPRQGGVPTGPTPYKKIISKASGKYGVDPRLIEAVIKAESGFNPDAVSDKGAEGLMQIMPKTQKMLDVSQPFNPSQNIDGGTKYLKGLIQKYNGDLPLALAAYNAGPKAVDQYGGVPPYQETQNYVKEVLSYYDGSKK